MGETHISGAEWRVMAVLWDRKAATAAEVIVDRADATKDHMGLHTWTDAPHGKIQKFDVVVAKNYLTESELAQLSRLVTLGKAGRVTEPKIALMRGSIRGSSASFDIGKAP